MTILINRNTTYLIMLSSENVILADFIASYSHVAPNVVITIPDGSIIGGTSTVAAIRTGDLSDYASVTLINNGEIQGRGGDRGGAGRDAIYASSDLHVINNSYIRSGGGGGASGYSGASGNWVNTWAAQQWDASTYVWYKYGVTNNACKYNGSTAYIGYANSYVYIYNGGYVYTYGSRAPDPFSGFNYIKRATLRTGVPGSGGAGGLGKGYSWTNSVGLSGSSGTYYAGTGGKGGTGGWWGANGSSGNNGGNGSQFKDNGDASFSGRWYSRQTTYATVNPPAILSAGKSLNAASGTTLSLENYGTIQGSQNNVT